MPEPKELLPYAESAYSQGDLGLAFKLYTEILGLGGYDGWANFCLGRIERDQDNADRAAEYFQKSIDADASFIWPHYEIICISDRCSVAIDLVASLECITSLLTVEIAIQFGRSVEHAFHRVFDAGFRLQAGRALVALLSMYGVSQLGLVRILETTEDAELARDLVNRLAGEADLGPDAIRVLLDGANRLKIHLPQELELAQNFKLQKPDDFHGFTRLVRILAASGDQIGLDALLNEARKFSVKQLSFLGIVAAIEQNRVEDSYFNILTHARLHKEVPLFLTVRLAYLLLEKGARPKLQTVLSMLDAFHYESPDVAVLIMIVAQRQFAFERADEVYLSRLAPLEPPPANARFARIDLLVALDRGNEAIRLLEIELAATPRPQNLIYLAMRIYLEKQRWDEAYVFGLKNISPSLSLEGFFSPMVRCARQLGRGNELLKRLTDLGETASPAAEICKAALIEDQIEAGDLGAERYIAGGDFSVERRHRFEAKARGVGLKFTNAVPSRAIFYCADKAYFMPAMVSLISFTMNNFLLSKSLTFFLMLEDEVYATEQYIVSRVCEGLRIDIRCVPASSALYGLGSLRSEYGLVTGGQSLSVAAYYRIFLARKLAESREFAEVLYLDADTMIRSGIGALFEIDLEKPLMARPEVERPEVQFAKEMNKIEGRYFNSGVLRFSLSNHRTINLLDKALGVAMDGQHKLIFQDQCALNIAFDGQCQPLPERFNHFIGPDVSDDEIARRDGVILHYLDRPKPWDGLYRRRAAEWFDWYTLFCDLVGHTYRTKKLVEGGVEL